MSSPVHSGHVTDRSDATVGNSIMVTAAGSSKDEQSKDGSVGPKDITPKSQPPTEQGGKKPAPTGAAVGNLAAQLGRETTIINNLKICILKVSN